MRNVAVALALIVVIFGAFFFFRRDLMLPTSNLTIRPSGYEIPQNTKPMALPLSAERYVNERFGFSLQTPEGYSVREIAEESGATILVENESKEGVQILVQPFDEDLRALTAERIREEIPDMQMTDVQQVAIGDTHTGIAFLSDNEAFGGASREVWFVFRRHLYQISTYARLDSLLQTLFSTWQFL